MKFSWFGYWKPTPVEIRKIADSVLASATLVSTYSFFTDNKNYAFALMIVSAIAKFLSNFFTDD
jgi:hypothetical protein